MPRPVHRTAACWQTCRCLRHDPVERPASLELFHHITFLALFSLPFCLFAAPFCLSPTVCSLLMSSCCPRLPRSAFLPQSREAVGEALWPPETIDTETGFRSGSAGNFASAVILSRTQCPKTRVAGSCGLRRAASLTIWSNAMAGTKIESALEWDCGTDLLRPTN